MNPGKTISIYDVAGLLGKAFPQAFTPKNIVNGFISTGIWPLNRNIYNDDDFLSSSVTDRPQAVPSTPSTGEPSTSSTAKPSKDLPPLEIIRNTTPLPLAQNMINESPTVEHQRETIANSSTNSNYFSPIEVRPYPAAKERAQQRKGKKRRKTQILTDTPIKAQIIDDLKKRQKLSKKNIFKPKTKSVLQKRIQEETSDEGSFLCADSDDSVGLPSDDDNTDLDGSTEVQVGDHVLIKEGHQVFSVGCIQTKTEQEVTVLYIRRLNPTFQFVRTDETYTFAASQIISKLPSPNPSGGTSRRAEMLIFPVDLHIYYNSLK